TYPAYPNHKKKARFTTGLFLRFGLAFARS
ncbi:MAG: hypothetical protein H6Q78_1183, partial [Candidatus Krumholzibacteriota bacterium]|nr:hypothetical protein [Candidatus Krumholzibacteriota bacterium]